MSARSKTITENGHDAKRMRALLGWTRTQWIDHAEKAIGEAMLVFLQARLCHKNGQRRLVRGMMLEVDRVLARGMLELLTHPVKRRFNYVDAFDEALGDKSRMEASLRRYVQTRFEQGHGRLRRPIEDRDMVEFWELARKHGTLATTYA